MRKDRVLAGALAAVTALSMTACGGGQAGGTTQAAAAGTQAAVENTANPNAETTLSIGYTTAANADDPYHFTATKFKEIVEEKSEGRIAVNLYASSQLGSEPEMWEGMQTRNMRHGSHDECICFFLCTGKRCIGSSVHF